MREELERRLVERWPTWFNVEGDIRETLMPRGFTHGDGWFDLVWRLCERLEPVVAAAEAETAHPFQVLQVKESSAVCVFIPTTTMTPFTLSLKPLR